MPLKPVSDSLRDTYVVLKKSFHSIKEHPELAIYPYVATLFISITYPLVSATVFANWYGRVFYNAGSYVPHRIGLIVGIVGFSVFYAALVGSYFSCIVSAAVLAKLENQPTPPLFGFRSVGRHFFRVTRFALLSAFFFPIGVYAQRKKLPDSWIAVGGSSLTLHMAQVAPSVLSTHEDVGDTIRHTVEVFGRAWRQGLVLKICMYSVIFLIAVLPKLIQHGFFSSPSAGSFGWILSLEIGASGLVGIKVLNSIFTAVLYHEARKQK